MLLPLTVSLYYYILYLNNFERKSFLCLSGFFSGLAVIFKQSALPPWLCLCIFLYFKSSNKLKDMVIFLMAGSLPILSCIVYEGVLLGFKDFLYLITFYRTETMSIFCGTWWYHILKFLYSVNKTGVSFWLIAIILGMKFVERQFTLNFLISYLFFSFFGVCLGGNWFTHYYIQLVPVICILLGWTTVKIWHSERRLYFVTNITLIILPFFIYGLVAIFLKPPYIYTSTNMEIVDYLSKNSKGTDKIYAFLYPNVSLYFLAKRQSPSPYLFKFDILPSEHINQIIKLIESPQKPSYLITYTEEKSINILKKMCEPPGKGILNKVKKCFSSTWFIFCKNYPSHIILTRKLFSILPEFYKPIKCIFSKDGKIIIWKKRNKISVNKVC